MKTQLPDNILNDVNNIKMTLGSRLAKVCLFGSSSYGDFDLANDIDIALFVDEPSLAEIRDQIVALDLNYPVEGKYINGTYKGPKIKIDKMKKHYDIIVLNNKEPNEVFMKINKNHLVQL